MHGLETIVHLNAARVEGMGHTDTDSALQKKHYVVIDDEGVIVRSGFYSGAVTARYVLGPDNDIGEQLYLRVGGQG